MSPKIKDAFELLRFLSFKKLWNASLLYWSYHLSRLTKKNFHRGLPLGISIEPTTSCNLRCPECPSGLRSFSRDTGNVKKEVYESILDELSPYLMHTFFYFQGEPYLSKDFLDMVIYARRKGIYTSTSTNAHYLNEETARKTVESGLSRLIISIDGTTQEAYEAYRKGGKLKKVIEGTRNIIKWKKELKSRTPHVIFQFLVVRQNEHQIPELYALAKELGVDEVKLKTAQVYDYENGNDLIPEQVQYSRYRKRADGKYELKNKLLNECWKMWHSCVFTWDGKVVPCCFDKDAKHQLGDIKEQGFKEIWRSEHYRHFRNSLLVSRSEIDICKNCSEGTKVWASS